jgi:hypothetical protein
LGNQVAQRFVQSSPLTLSSPSLYSFGDVCQAPPARVQAKLPINEPGDRYEQEADRTADLVVRMPEVQHQYDPEDEEEEIDEMVQTVPISTQISSLIQRPVEPEAEEKEKEGLIYAKRLLGRSTKVTPELESRIQFLRGGGQPLPETMRAFFEPRFGYDFRGVRVNTDAQASEMAQAMNAHAFTVGQHIVFGTGKYAPGISAGRRLLAHELTHVVQQGLHRTAIRIQRFSPLDATQMSITEEWASTLDDAELAEQIKRVREQLLTSNPGTQVHEAARLNLQILETELAVRPRSISELAVPPLPTAVVILVGSPTNYQTQGYDRYPYNYTDAAVKVVSKIQTVMPGAHVTILYFSLGYKLRGADVHRKALKDLTTGATVVEVTTSDEVINFLDTGLISPDESIPTRAVRVSQFFYFGHGTSDEMLLNWGWGRENHDLSKEDIINIKTDAFDPKGGSYLFTCHIAQGQNSFLSTWVSHLGQISVGPRGNAAFNAKYDATDLEKAINKELPKWFLGLPYMNKVKIIDPERKATE